MARSTLSQLFAEGQRIPELDDDDFRELAELVEEDRVRRFGALDGYLAQQTCRGCGASFPYDPQADFCPGCAADNAGDSEPQKRDRALAALLRDHGQAIAAAEDTLTEYAAHARNHGAEEHAREYDEAADNLDDALDRVDSVIRTLEGC